MTDQSTSSDVNADLTDQQVDKFFESGGESEISESTSSSSEENEKAESHSQSQEIESRDSSTEEMSTKQEKKVPYGALHEERERRKELQRQIQEVSSKNQRMEERFQQMVDRLAFPQQQAQQQMPSYEEDPVGTLRSRQEAMERFLTQQAHEYTQRQQQEVAQNQFINRYYSSAQAYAKENPGFADAYQHLSQARFKEYQMAGFSPEESASLVNKEEAEIVFKAYQDGVNPAERLYSLAKLRGYKESELKANEQKIDQLEKGVQASRSLSGSSGKSNKPMRLEDIAELPDDEFEKVDWNKLMRSMA